MLPDGSHRMSAIAHALGMSVLRKHRPARQGREGVRIELAKYLRGETPVGDYIGCAQQRSVRRKDNSWFFMEYEIEDRRVRGGSRRHMYICHFQYLIKAEYKTVDGRNRADECATLATPLYLGIARLYKCHSPQTPGARERDFELGRPPEFFKVDNLSPVGEADRSKAYEGQWLVDLETLTAQLTPTKNVEGGRFFMTANKASGR